jgi:hypothetical protein
VKVFDQAWTKTRRVSSFQCSDKPAVVREPAAFAEKFAKFEKKYKKKYGSDVEREKRFHIFQENMKKIAELQKHEQGTAKYGVTRFADLSGASRLKILDLSNSFFRSRFIKFFFFPFRIETPAPKLHDQSTFRSFEQDKTDHIVHVNQVVTSYNTSSCFKRKLLVFSLENRSITRFSIFKPRMFMFQNTEVSNSNLHLSLFYIFVKCRRRVQEKLPGLPS